jgi:hypothetical protein
MQVKGNRFVRYWPKTPDSGTLGFDCSAGNSMQMTKTYEPLPQGFG